MSNILYDTFWFFHSPFICYIITYFNNPHYDWAKMCVQYFDVKIKKVSNGNNPLLTKCIYFTNHRSEADFFVDQYLTHGHSIFLSRMMVGVYMYFYLPVALISRSLFLFSRNTKNRKVLYESVDNYWNKSKYSSLLVYPEGTRNQSSQSLPLKSGFIDYAYCRKIPVQIFISRNKERIFSLQCNNTTRGMNLQVAYARALYPEDYTNVGEFTKDIHILWDTTWKEAYDKTVDSSDFFPYVPKSIPYNRIEMNVMFLSLIFGTLYLYIQYPILLLYPFIGLLQIQSNKRGHPKKKEEH